MSPAVILGIVSAIRGITEIINSVKANSGEGPTPEYLEAQKQLRAQVTALLESLA